MKRKEQMPDMHEWRKKRYKIFNEKIDSFKEHKKYSWLRQYADDAMRCNEGTGFLMIKGADFIERIECMPLDYIKDWLDGKNELEWKEEWKPSR